mgnify:CR=1 FL=1
MGLLGDRSLGFVLENARRPANYRALAAAPLRYRRPVDTLGRYFLSRGDYPAQIEVRTPTGVLRPTVYSAQDVITVHEMFCRQDYRAGAALGAVVDIGSNIGLSALYFLSRNSTSRCYLYEPVPRNVERLRGNLAAFEGRWFLEQAAVADRSGTLPFTVEETGRYGGLGVRGDEQIEVEVREINDVLRAVLEREPVIDLLKLDTEGAEAATVRAIAPELLARVRVIVCEDETGEIALPGWRRHTSCDTTRLENPVQSPA